MTDQQQKKILVVEDEEYLRDLYVQILKEEGYIVESASNGEEALDMCMKNVYDLILLDVILPKMDGLQVLDTLAKSGKKSFHNIVLLTNLGQDLVVAKALDYGVSGYMIKSDYTPEEILKEIKGYLENKTMKSSL